MVVFCLLALAGASCDVVEVLVDGGGGWDWEGDEGEGCTCVELCEVGEEVEDTTSYCNRRCRALCVVGGVGVMIIWCVLGRGEMTIWCLG